MKALHIFFIATLSLLVLPSFAEEKEFVFLVRSRGNPYWNSVVSGIKDSATAHGVKATIFQSESESAGEEQLNNCLTAIQRKPVFLSITAATTSAGIQCLKKASEAGIGVGEMDSTIPLDEAKKAGIPLAYSVGSNNYAMGQKAGEFAATIIGDSDAEVLVLEDAPGIQAGTLRTNGFKDELKSTPKAKIVASTSANGDRLKATTITHDIIQQFPNLRMVYAANDLIALGAVEAIKAQSKLQQIAVIGIDGTADARKAVLNGEMTATVAHLPYLIGKRAVDLAIMSLRGENFSEREFTDTPVLTKELLSQKDSPVLEYIR